MKAKDKKVLVVGAGFTGLSAALDLVKNGYSVEVWEKSERVGGLANGFKSEKWKWNLERYYHHIFAGDKEIIDLANEVGASMKLYLPLTSSLVDGKEVQLDSPVSLLKFSKLSIFSRLWMGVGLLILKLIPNGLFLEKYKAVDMLPWLIGKEGYAVVWEKLLKAKFGKYTNEVNMAWFWSRVAKRTQKLGYFEGGFEELANKTALMIEEKGGKVKKKLEVEKIEKEDNGCLVNDKSFDAVLFTSPLPVTERILGKKFDLPKIDYLWSQTLILELKKSVLTSYWLNILDEGFPFLVAVEHTNMIDKDNYDNKVIVYLGNYLEAEDARLNLSDKDLLTSAVETLKKINPKFEKTWINNYWRFKSDFAQPVFPVNYSQLLPKIKQEAGLYIANMSMVYPFDRGTNYAVEIGQRAAKIISEDLEK